MKKSLNASGIKVDNFSIKEYNNNSVLTSENTTDLGFFLIPSTGVPGRTQDVTGYILTSATEDGKLEWTSGEQFGDVKGPSSSVNNALVRFDSTSGKLIKNSSVIVDDIGNMNIYGNLNVFNEFILGNKITLSSGNPLSNYSLTLPVGVGSAGEVLKTDGLGQLYWSSSSGGGSPGGVNGSVQYNDNNTFGGDTNFSWDTLNQKLSVKGSIELKGSTVGEIGIYASSSTISYDVILPPTQGNVNTFLQNNGTGALSWAQGSSSSGNLNNIQLSDGIGGFISATEGTFTFVDGNPTSYLTLGIENGEIIIKGQDATNSSAVGSNLSIFGGSGGTDANGGEIILVTGQGGSISGDSGSLSLKTNDCSTNNSITGNVYIETGINTVGFGSGFLDIKTGDVSGTNNVSSGSIYIQTGESFGDGNYSGNINIIAGNSSSKTDLSGVVFITGGFGKDGTRGGNVTITGGSNGDIISTYTGGDVIIKGGMGGGINQGGKVLIESGENNNVLLKTDTNIIFEVGSSQYTWPITGATANQVLSSGSVPGIMEWIQQPTLIYALQAISIQDGVGSNNVDALNLQYLGIPGGTLYKRSSSIAVLNNIDFPNFTSSQEEYDPFGIRGDEITGDPSELNIVNKLGSGWYKISVNVQHPYSNSLNIPVTNGGTNQSDQGNFCIGIKQGLTGPVPDSLDGQQVEWGFLDSSWLIPETAHYSAINKVNTDPLRFIMSANTVKTETFIIRIEIIKYT